MSRQTSSTSSGFVISGRKLLTNAHAVTHHTVVRVKKRASDYKYVATVLAIGQECDLALLSVADPDFWTDLNPLPFRPLPELQNSVIVVGYPLGGENISVTAGVISRIELQDYSPASNLLSIQIDAAINSGNSGGPALNQHDEVVGVAFQTLRGEDTENIGYLIPQTVVHHFLSDYVAHGAYTGFCHCGFLWQPLENRSMRRYMQMPEDETGVLVRDVMQTSASSSVLQDDDILTRIDDLDISNAGTVPYTSGERISFHFIITTKFVGDIVKLRILRKGNPIAVQYKLPDSNAHLLVPVHERVGLSDYFMVGGLVFVTLSEPYLITEYGPKWRRRAPVQLQKLCELGKKRSAEESVVILSQVLQSAINVDYEHLVDESVHKVNGTTVRNLRHLAQIIDESKMKFLRFDLSDEIVILGREEALKEDKKILDLHHIPSTRSFAKPIGSLR